ncbi:MAG: hypothetical protein ACR652_24550 [Methylocystis sp.]|uniref:hypothetical protein n=1 Tax=Methylocystis sp. TaxID=1911079 RepID=UPI003DA25631
MRNLIRLRKVVQFQMRHTTLYVLLSDGTLWRGLLLEGGGYQWHQIGLEGIPLEVPA